MPKYIVNRDSGWPMPAEAWLAPKFKQGESFESNDSKGDDRKADANPTTAECNDAVTLGYLIRVEETKKKKDASSE